MNGSTLTPAISTNDGQSFQSLGSYNDTAYARGKIGVSSFGTTARFDQITAIR
jgi:hypothetical protein